VQAFNARDPAGQRFGMVRRREWPESGIWQGMPWDRDGRSGEYLSVPAGGSYDGVSNFGSSTLNFEGPSLKLATV